MRALAYHRGSAALADVPEPVPAAGQVLLDVAACGVCQTDVHLVAGASADLAPGRVLGHEIAGRVAALGPGVDGVDPDRLYVVHPVWSCGRCRSCRAGRENACLATPGRLVPPPGPGIRYDGGLAERVVVPVAALVPADGVDPAAAAVLPDAGLVAWHCLRDARPLESGSAALVIGLGGLGLFAVALLRATTEARVIAVDVRAAARAAAGGHADVVLDGAATDLAAQVLDAAGGHGPDLVVDLVGTDATLALAGAVVAPYGAIRVPGQGGGALRFETDRATRALPRGATISRTYSGTRAELAELVELARRGVGIPLARYPLADVERALDDLAAGRVVGRAVVETGTAGPTQPAARTAGKERT